MAATISAAVEGPYSRALRWVHLAILTLVVAMATTGLIFYFRADLGLKTWKLQLQTLHSIIGLCLLAALSVRVALALLGAAKDRLSLAFPRFSDIGRLFAPWKRGASASPYKFAGRSPLSRTIAGLLYCALALNITTGLVFANIELYFPPFGHLVQSYVAKEGTPPEMIRPHDKTYVDPARYEAAQKRKRPFGLVHFYGAMAIIGLAAFHALGALLTEWSATNNPRARGRALLMLLGPRQAS